MLFAGDLRASVREKHPNMKITEVAKTLGEMWRNKSIEEKKPWEDKSSKLKQEFREKYPKLEKPKKKPKTTPKKTPKKRKTAETESDDSETSDEEPLNKKKKGSIEQQLKEEIIVILKEGDLDTLSVKKIRTQLKEKYGEEPVREHKALIKEFINSELEKL